MIKSLAGEFPIKALCRVLGVSRSGYYAAQQKAQRPRARDNARLGAKIKDAFEASRRTYGSPRVTVVLRRAGETCGRHRGGAADARAAPARHAEAPFSTSHDRQPASLPGGTQPPGRAHIATHSSRRGLAGGHHLRCHPGGLALRGRCHRPPARAGWWVGPPTRPCPRAWWRAPSSEPCVDASPRAGCSTTPTAAASTPATPTASCCVATARPRA